MAFFNLALIPTAILKKKERKKKETEMKYHLQDKNPSCAPEVSLQLSPQDLPPLCGAPC
jgi:hypothetical protein